jgi:Tol biopolymer transport system component
VMPSELSPPVSGGVLSIDGEGFEPFALPDPSLNLVPQAWSPDGTRIAFEGWDDADPGRTGVYTARASDLGGLVRVTTGIGKRHDIPLDYSPDGTQLVIYRSVRAEPHFPIDIGGSLWVVDVDGSNAHRLETPGTKPGWWARWSPDGTKILFATERLQPTGALWTIGPDGSGLTKVFEDAEGRFATGPTWSPDGRQILFTLNPTRDSFVHDPNALYVIDADGSDLTLVVGGAGFKGSPEWWR